MLWVISVCTENTNDILRKSLSWPVYLRMYGEHITWNEINYQYLGLSPYVRRTH
ncbi:conserved hypothetical protein [Xenorhabdus bovienii str. feltiae Moldova]|uniref:Uncharacterized protein n=1 Tax=Xenorhabdus bovienii str. feltiae Moldova TaxID=1398200 RepID=A0A077P2K7_XENBV|nr:conserved hypothetical protein [Xenorhabdus bovienii str. feltiae Moldova]